MSSGGVNTATQNTGTKKNWEFQIRDGSDWIAFKRRSIQNQTENRPSQTFSTKDPWFSYGNNFRSETIQGCRLCSDDLNTKS